MRILLATTVLSSALLAACGSSAPPPPAPVVAPIANAVTGTVSLIEPRELSDAAKVDVKVYDVSHPEIVLAQTTIPNANKLPLSFSLPIDTAKVDPKGIYALDAILTDGDRRFLKKLEYQVLTDKARTAKVDVQLAPEPTPAEKLFEEYKKAAAQTGNLKQVSGKYSNDNFGTAWDAFLSNGKVKFVREVTDAYDDSGRTTYKAAYKDDKPWAIVRESSPVGSRQVLSSTRVGWGDDGSLVLHEKVVNGQTSDVSEADAKAMKAHAEAALDVAQGHAPKPQTGAQTDEKAKKGAPAKKHR
ncbi:MAG: YbaY family lipoprotein [Proteobacteria bacterium]|uniref:YbaY family lipoprotein n=1 Tax=Rudaea sp. TaxID=2136325 RepID=UPI001D6EB5BD|nr:YbaY family lipoprotein [Pseudomonadota bacterium]MBS0568782.1 YbaY family lipoprotein [Pseudomonadota bacterium]